MRAFVYTFCARYFPTHLEHQQGSCAELVKQKRYAVIDTTNDEGRERPGLDRLRWRAPEGEFDVLMMADLSRLGRDYFSLEKLIRELRQTGVELDACDEPIIPDSFLQLTSVIFRDGSKVGRRSRLVGNIRGSRPWLPLGWFLRTQRAGRCRRVWFVIEKKVNQAGPHSDASGTTTTWPDLASASDNCLTHRIVADPQFHRDPH